MFQASITDFFINRFSQQFFYSCFIQRLYCSNYISQDVQFTKHRSSKIIVTQCIIQDSKQDQFLGLQTQVKKRKQKQNEGFQELMIPSQTQLRKTHTNILCKNTRFQANPLRNSLYDIYFFQHQNNLQRLLTTKIFTQNKQFYQHHKHGSLYDIYYFQTPKQFVTTINYQNIHSKQIILLASQTWFFV
eukprot:TRINITY_DN16348_c0_g1_i1.p1 TRINITY_DN16348_c0_g1~~TRINITY_DN16348_c0_g1_i1.p1  ORF type:complete len:188 (-),score=-21.10 TRINITY_DN16348_c0_g1_i1:169-732(-)